MDDGDRLTEAPAVLQYIADKAPSWAAYGYHLQEWLNFVTSELHKNFSPLFRPNTPDDYKPIAKEDLAQRFAYLERQLADKTYLMGQQFTGADAYLFTVLNRTKFLKFDLNQWPTLKAYYDRIAARPKVQEAMRAECPLKAAA
jgi:glutathione S-transferase